MAPASRWAGQCGSCSQWLIGSGFRRLPSWRPGQTRCWAAGRSRCARCCGKALLSEQGLQMASSLGCSASSPLSSHLRWARVPLPPAALHQQRLDSCPSMGVAGCDSEHLPLLLWDIRGPVCTQGPQRTKAWQSWWRHHPPTTNNPIIARDRSSRTGSDVPTHARSRLSSAGGPAAAVHTTSCNLLS